MGGRRMYLRLNSFTSPGGDLVPGLDFLFKQFLTPCCRGCLDIV